MPSPSPEQLAATNFCLTNPSSSLIVDAVAGSGKTSWLLQLLAQIKGSTSLQAFNKKIQLELEAKVQKLPVLARMSVEVKTSHAIGLAALKAGGGTLSKSRTYGGKLASLYGDMTEHLDRQHPLRKGSYQIRNLVSYAKSAGFDLEACDGFEHFDSSADEQAWLALIDHYNLETELDSIGLSNAEAIRWAQRLFKQSVETHSMIDFDDMIYLPLQLKLKFRQYMNVMIDEAQDINATRRELVFRMRAPNGRIIAVGDPHQAIYGFTGADAESLNNIQRRSQAERLPLSVCWRCDQNIIAEAQRYVPHIKSHDTEGKGEVSELEFDDQFLDILTEGDVVLCRLNKPNVAVAVGLLRRGRNARIEGRDLGAKLLSHARKAAPDLPKLEEIQLALEPYLAHQVQLLVNADKESSAALLEDEVDALNVLIDRCLETGKNTFRDLETLCETLFQDDAHKQKCILLCSVHKSKGLEWPRVYILGRRDYMPFFKAELDWEKQQEYNLIYVAITRAAHELIYVNGVQKALADGLHRKAGRAISEPEPKRDTVVAPPAFLQQGVRMSRDQASQFIRGLGSRQADAAEAEHDYDQLLRGIEIDD